MEELTLILTSILGFCTLFYALAAYIRPYSRLKAISSAAKRVLLVIAHPDDETMFFGPTMLNLSRREETEVYLLCLSNGDYRNKGKVRKRELYKACGMLGVPEENITVLRYTRLRDDPRVRWREELVSDIVQQHVVSHDIDVVITFDRGGVSGHKNHSSVYNALALLHLEKRLPKTVQVFCLRSVNLLRKYSLVFDVPMSFLLAHTAYVASLSDWWTIQKAMSCHHSQYVWFRKAYMLFSRYVVINTFDRLNAPSR